MNNTLITPWEDQFYDPALFDAAAGDAYSDEAEELYFDLIGNTPRKIIEYGCGTGRVILKLADKGHTVTGVDISESMLTHLDKKIHDLPPHIQCRIKTIRANGTEAVIKDSHHIAIAVDDFLTHFLEEERVLYIFRQIAACIEPDGCFITDLRIRDTEKLRQAQHSYPKNIYTYGIVHGVHTDKGTFSASMKYWEDYDTTSGILCSHQTFDFIRGNGEVEKTVYKTLRQKLLTQQELVTFAGMAGFDLRQFIPFDRQKDSNAGIYVFQLKDPFQHHRQ